MKKYLFLLCLLLILSGCSLSKTSEVKKIHKSSSHTSTEQREVKQNTINEKPTDQTSFEQELDDMLKEIDNLDLAKEDDGYPKELK
ncbi:lipoprotein [Bacillus sp. RG28]|uniref:Lipoprotein n=1 Tax=Gottfriedia endophytica TaxID=2820819 RepID=A0A940NM69_9BACI|nr:lipoprotein [Gottfriedia endophytica]MBP0726837.1 lipoprotein [Gottfriedia endophytica]